MFIIDVFGLHECFLAEGTTLLYTAALHHFLFDLTYLCLYHLTIQVKLIIIWRLTFTFFLILRQNAFEVIGIVVAASLWELCVLTQNSLWSHVKTISTVVRLTLGLLYATWRLRLYLLIHLRLTYLHRFHSVYFICINWSVCHLIYLKLLLLLRFLVCWLSPLRNYFIILIRTSFLMD